MQCDFDIEELTCEDKREQCMNKLVGMKRKE